MKVLSFVFNPFQENTYVVAAEDGRCVVVDPGMYGMSERLAFSEALAAAGLTVEAVLLTHAHADHVSGVTAVADGVPVYLHPADLPTLEGTSESALRWGLQAPDCGFKHVDVADGQVVSAAGLDFKVMHTPGHSPGSVSYLIESEGVLFSGDTLFAGTIGRTDLPGGDYDAEMASILEKIMVLDASVKVYPGHGPETTIADESTGNPFLEPFNEIASEDFPEDLEPIVINPDR